MAEVYRELERQGKLKTRVYDCISLSDWAKTKQRFAKSDPDAMVRTGCLKGFHDGDDEWTPTLKADVIAADKAGWQIVIHAIGAKPNRIVLDIFEETARLNGKRDRRFRLEHAEGITKEDMPRLGKLGIIASVQPYLFGGAAGIRNGYYAELKQNGAILALGSDAPMTELDPFRGITAALGSKDERGLSMEEALRAYTAGSTFAEFQEGVKGAIEVGKLADIVIISTSIFGADPTNIILATAEMTIIDGKVVYESSK
jgi:predicted amidohydrolase YtcJ